MFEFQQNKSKLNVNAPLYMPKNVKTSNINPPSFFNKEKSPFNFLQSRNEDGIISSEITNKITTNNLIFHNFQNVPFPNQEISKTKEDTFEISSFMIDKSVFKKICSSSIYIENYPMQLKPAINEFNQGGKLNLHMLLNQKPSATLNLNMNMNFIPAFKERECFLCLQLMTKGKKFGLLVNCEHIFCIECIKLWRKELLIAKKNEMYRHCPVCKTESFHVIPSEIFLTDKILKMNLAQEKKKKLSKIPCKYISSGKDECPFGFSCFYNHTIN